MWYLIINEVSERFFIKKKTDDLVYFVKEYDNKIKEITIQELRKNNFFNRRMF